MIMNKFPESILLTLLLITGCTTSPDSNILSEIDSLVAAEEYDSAHHEIVRTKGRFDRPQDLAHYQLLLAKTSYLTYNTLPSDSIIDQAIAFYEKANEPLKLADAYYYKAACSHERRDYAQAIRYYKKAEEEAQKTDDLALKYKIAESIVKINSQNNNDRLQLNYAHQALQIALESGNKNWMAYSYFNLCRAYQNIGDIDSMTNYAKQLITRLDDIYPEDKPAFLSCIGYMYYKKSDWQLAKKYYKESLDLQKTAHTMVNLADVYVKEGNEKEAYKLWGKAFLMNDCKVKDIIMFNMLQYDLDHHRNLEDACDRLYGLYITKDSMENALRDRTIQEMQQQYDQDREKNNANKRQMKWMMATLTLTLIIICLLTYLKYRKQKATLQMAEQQSLINTYMSEAHFLKAKVQDKEALIKEYKKKLQTSQKEEGKLTDEEAKHQLEMIEKYRTQIQELECEREEALEKIDKLNDTVRDLVKQAAPRLNHGKILYDSIVENGSAGKWSNEDYKCFIEYYKAIDLANYKRIEKEYPHLTLRNSLFLILHEMGKNDDEVEQIMGLSHEGIRSTRFRIRSKKR